jgi:hypothetical protein
MKKFVWYRIQLRDLVWAETHTQQLKISEINGSICSRPMKYIDAAAVCFNNTSVKVKFFYARGGDIIIGCKPVDLVI